MLVLPVTLYNYPTVSSCCNLPVQQGSGGFVHFQNLFLLTLDAIVHHLQPCLAAFYTIDPTSDHKGRRFNVERIHSS